MSRMVSNIISALRGLCGRTAVAKVLSLTSLATIVRMCTGLVSVKVAAAVIGPAGVALLGQLGNFVNIAQTVAGGGIGNGITKYVSEHKTDSTLLKSYLSAALQIVLVSSLLCGVLMVIFHRQLSRLVLLGDGYGYVFVIFGFTIVLYALNAAMLAAVNGFKMFRTFVAVNIAGSVAGMLFTVALVFICGLRGALISAVTYQSAVFFVSLWMLRRVLKLRLREWRSGINTRILRQYGGYALMSLVTALTVPLVQMLLRGYVMTGISETQAGIWEGMQKISSIYLMVITTSLSVYYLPRLSEIGDSVGLRREIAGAFKITMPLLLVSFAIIYFLRYVIIAVLFTPEFMPMQELFVWQMAGDLIRIASWLLAFIMVAKAMTVRYIVTEVFSALCYLVLGYAMTAVNGIVGLVQANFINYIIYFGIMAFIFRSILFGNCRHIR